MALLATKMAPWRWLPLALLLTAAMWLAGLLSLHSLLSNDAPPQQRGIADEKHDRGRSVRKRGGHISEWEFSEVTLLPQLASGDGFRRPQYARDYNPSVVRLPNGTLLVYARRSTSNMCPGYERGKSKEPEDVFHGVVGSTFDPGTLGQVGATFGVEFALETTSGGDLRCDEDVEDVGSGAPHLQDVRMFWLRGRLAVLLLVCHARASLSVCILY